jgi:hypothetical protein
MRVRVRYAVQSETRGPNGFQEQANPWCFHFASEAGFAFPRLKEMTVSGADG